MIDLEKINRDYRQSLKQLSRIRYRSRACRAAEKWLSDLIRKLVNGTTVLTDEDFVKNYSLHAKHLPKSLQNIARQLRLDIGEKTTKSQPPSVLNVHFTQPVENNGLFNASEGDHDKDHALEAARIFLETQTKRLLHALFPWVKRFKYFSNNETKADIYQRDAILPKITQGIKIYNLGHASQLVQVPGINILTDPSFGNLNGLLYPAMTEAGVKARDLPPIDVILISHNHRDHVDVDSLKQLIKLNHQPLMLVPKGSSRLFKDLGFLHVEEFAWYEQIAVSRNHHQVEFCAVPADHWSGRGLFDKNRSSVNGWLINPLNAEGVFYFAGDTAKLSEERMRGIAYLIYTMNKGKNSEPKIYNFQPGGPNYTRRDMESTHQSILDSLISVFELVTYIKEFEQELENDKLQKTSEEWLACATTIIMHHNKYQLGPDRFNESLFIFQRAIQLLQYNDDRLGTLATNERNKGFWQNIWSRNEAFLYEGVIKLRHWAAQTWPEDQGHAKLIGFLTSRTHAPKIGQGINGEQCFPNFATPSAYRPTVSIPDTMPDKLELQKPPSKISTLQGALTNLESHKNLCIEMSKQEQSRCFFWKQSKQSGQEIEVTQKIIDILNNQPVKLSPQDHDLLKKGPLGRIITQCEGAGLLEKKDDNYTHKLGWHPL
jgi:hypothetical protein